MWFKRKQKTPAENLGKMVHCQQQFLQPEIDPINPPQLASTYTVNDFLKEARTLNELSEHELCSLINSMEVTHWLFNDVRDEYLSRRKEKACTRC